MPFRGYKHSLIYIYIYHAILFALKLLFIIILLRLRLREGRCLKHSTLNNNSEIPLNLRHIWNEIEL